MEISKLTNLLVKSKILVIGDVILDIHREGEVVGVSAETPTIVVKNQVYNISFGGAGLLVRNILALGGKVDFITLMGDDELAQKVSQWTHPNLKLHYFQEPGRATTAKERFWVNNHKLLQWDYLDNRPISKKTEKAIISYIKKNLHSFDKLIISDYRHGLLTPSLASALITETKKKKMSLYVDSQVSQNKSNHKWYRGAGMICLNAREAISAFPDFKVQTSKTSLEELGRKLNTKNIILKLGKGGSASLLNGRYIRTTGVKVRALDTVGAGDAFLAALAVVEELSPITLRLANLWAALSTTVLGPEPASLEMLKDNLDKI